METVNLLSNQDLLKNVNLTVKGSDLILFAERLLIPISKQKTEKEPEEEFITSDEVCRKFAITAPTLWSWDNKGITNPLKIGRVKRYKKSEIERLFDEKGA